MFGLPAWAIIALVAIVGGLFLGYKEKELKLEEKALMSNKQAQELKKMIHHLTSRVDELEREIKKTKSSSSLNIDFDDDESDNGDTNRGSSGLKN